MLVNEMVNKYRKEMDRFYNLPSLNSILIDFSNELDEINDEVKGREIVEVISASYFTSKETVNDNDVSLDDFVNTIKENVKDFEVNEKVIRKIVLSVINKLSNLENSMDILTFIPYTWKGDYLLVKYIK